ncbi:hypothetical protein BJF79_19505 [Actinomadura sp. CNU-125]|uniref:alpha/beta fold hydrolase n=1 Tax=Actinomadura sp. CNU-125 TaxID=1904961 RepID=UPI00095AFF94|nr:alpha/beta fold hydrolase [Actinomadura sp. CNU-125]OLT13876.1 hypothetical protein BJF79_19505 [Actinomadura sp. CNU-125]
MVEDVWTGPEGTWAYERRGASGPGIVLLHGMMFDRAMWRPVAENLARDHIVVSLDLPGHGASSPRRRYAYDEVATDLDALVRDLRVGDPVIVGHSAAALLATRYAARHPVRAVVNVDQPLAVAELAERLGAAGALDDEQLVQLTELLIASMSLDSIPEPHRALVSPQPTPDVVRGWQQEMLATTPEGLQTWIETSARSITAPYLAVFSREPWPGHDSWLRKLMPQARCEVYNVEGHFPHLMDIARFTASLRDVAAG